MSGAMLAVGCLHADIPLRVTWHREPPWCFLAICLPTNACFMGFPAASCRVLPHTGQLPLCRHLRAALHSAIGAGPPAARPRHLPQAAGHRQGAVLGAAGGGSEAGEAT